MYQELEHKTGLAHLYHNNYKGCDSNLISEIGSYQMPTAKTIAEKKRVLAFSQLGQSSDHEERII